MSRADLAGMHPARSPGARLWMPVPAENLVDKRRNVRTCGRGSRWAQGEAPGGSRPQGKLPILCAPPTSPAPPGEWEEWKRPDFLPTQRAPWVTGIPWPAHAFSHGDFFSGSFPMGQSTAINQHTLDSIPTRDKLVPKLKKKKKSFCPAHCSQLPVDSSGFSPRRPHPWPRSSAGSTGPCGQPQRDRHL